MNNSKYFLLAIFIVVNLTIFLRARRKSKQDFYSDTFVFFPLGIYVLGDALILAPFWLFSSIIFFFISPQNILRYIITFYTIRSFYEVFYWLNHQSVKSDYNPPLFRKIKWIKANESAILYQLIHTCIVVIGIFLLVSV
ncbi:MAG: hypothetical protein CO039_01125 [Candidatus Pacebacteria bacterium CG_4_9_14_0_2_um_filter_34_50]|nr:MAG: hypothetical protein CO039_01125 [Candidatus Pacebacteria bacterium CG_4_9_14_0_2_um_filter_34_50]